MDFSVSGSRYRGEIRGINTLSIDSDVWLLKVRRALLRLPAIGSIVGCYRSSQSARKLGFAKLAFKAGINPALRRAALSIYKRNGTYFIPSAKSPPGREGPGKGAGYDSRLAIAN